MESRLRSARLLIEALGSLAVARLEPTLGLRLDSGRSGEHLPQWSGSSRMEMERAFAMANRLRPASCLPRSTALRRFLRRHGHPAELRLGLRRDNGRTLGHAWVEVEGTVVGDRADFVRSFVVLRTTRRQPAATRARAEEA